MITLGPVTAVAIGDAYGAQYEYRKGRYEDYAATNTGEFLGDHPTHTDFKAGHYTDDTQMSIAIAELLLQAAKDGQLPTAPFIAQHFLDCYMRDIHAGYSKGMAAAMEKAYRSDIPLEIVCAQFGKSQKSGAAMRATPIGLLPNPLYMRGFARKQGEVTHMGTALRAAEATAFAAQYMLYKLGPREHLLTFITNKMQEMKWMTPWSGKVGSLGMESTRAALTAVVQATSLRDLLIRCVAFTGDVDTVAAIAMGAAWAYEDLPNDLPDSLWEGLENGPYGREYLKKLDEHLLATFPVPAVAHLAA